MAGIATFEVTVTATAVQVTSIKSQGKSLTISASGANTADVIVSSSSTVTGGFILPKGTTVTIPGVTDTAALWVSGTSGDKVSGVVSL